MPKILALSGSSRRGSFNLTLLDRAVEAARAAGGEVTVVDLRDYALPLYDGDLEAAQGLPAGAHAFKAALAAHEGLLIASPEYNSAPTPLLLNAIDWASRKAEGDPPAGVLRGKTAALCAASPGALGGMRGLFVLRNFLMNLGVLVLPGEVAVPAAHQAFDAQGRFLEGGREPALRALMESLVRRLGPPA
jgi:NAD(P)H-dependent FMN reductase